MTPSHWCSRSAEAGFLLDHTAHRTWSTASLAPRRRCTNGSHLQAPPPQLPANESVELVLGPGAAQGAQWPPCLGARLASCFQDIRCQNRDSPVVFKMQVMTQLLGLPDAFTKNTEHGRNKIRCLKKKKKKKPGDQSCWAKKYRTPSNPTSFR